ncbi:MAG: class I SAM-dependent methyltransferase [Rhodoplanes sp.]|uniref:class I SAM-dependent methyltransferase n=1 Tax=Rhodoplanes sp. TaxID=1968906 RepID=UPI0018233B29|nr:class I SAM-dependent methyltransferase [Rhodoplanes sp.]NVO16831.1 class I SAM-dependent methyltransferase [Rhodoplanes sp.]
MLQRSVPDTLACPACGGLTRQRLLYRKHGCAILRCEGCGLGRTETAGFDPATYYTDGYFSGEHADGYADYRGAEPVLRREFARTVDFIRRFRNHGRLIEAGCAYGFFLAEAAHHYDVAGIEIAEDAAAFCRSRGLDVVTGVVEPATLDRLGTPDAVVMLDVIEHLPAPDDTLSLIAERLAPGGIVVLTTGDFGSAVARLAGGGWRLMTPPQHLWFFTVESLHRLAAAHGLVVAHVDHPWKIVPASLILHQLGRMTGLGARTVPAASRLGLPVNLFDAIRVVLRKP